MLVRLVFQAVKHKGTRMTANIKRNRRKQEDFVDFWAFVRDIPRQSAGYHLVRIFGGRNDSVSTFWWDRFDVPVFFIQHLGHQHNEGYGINATFIVI